MLLLLLLLQCLQELANKWILCRFYALEINTWICRNKETFMQSLSQDNMQRNTIASENLFLESLAQAIKRLTIKTLSSLWKNTSLVYRQKRLKEPLIYLNLSLQ